MFDGPASEIGGNLDPGTEAVPSDTGANKGVRELVAPVAGTALAATVFGEFLNRLMSAKGDPQSQI